MFPPLFAEDIWASGALPDDPYPIYKRMRDMAPAVRFAAQDAIAVGRFHGVKTVLSRSDVFVSGKGVTMNAVTNQLLEGLTLASDGEQHDRQKRVIMKPLMPAALSAIRAEIFAAAETHVATLVDRGDFDVVTDLAHHLPISIISNLVGLPEEGRERMLVWAAATFDSSGPTNARSEAGLALVGEMMHYALTEAVPGRLKPGSWAEAIYEAVDRGEVPPEQAVPLMLDYLGPSLDTTINATTNTIRLFAENPAQWDLVRADPSLIPGAINESLRLESPIQYFTRLSTIDFDLEEVTIPAGSRVAVFYGSANRDERRWEDPEQFDVRRKTPDQLAFGIGAHACAGMNLARLEINALLTALAKRVERFDVGRATMSPNNSLRGLSALPVTLRCPVQHLATGA